ncbi:hypothetical protein L9F63_017366, partial [Diploptera punctata]
SRTALQSIPDGSDSARKSSSVSISPDNRHNQHEMSDGLPALRDVRFYSKTNAWIVPYDLLADSLNQQVFLPRKSQREERGARYGGWLLNCLHLP